MCTVSFTPPPAPPLNRGGENCVGCTSCSRGIGFDGVVSHYVVDVVYVVFNWESFTPTLKRCGKMLHLHFSVISVFSV